MLVEARKSRTWVHGYMGYVECMEVLMLFYFEIYFLNSIILFFNWEIFIPCIFTCSCLLELSGCFSLK